MHTVKFSDADLNILARALDTAAEQSIALKNSVVAQVQEAQKAKAKPEKKK